MVKKNNIITIVILVVLILVFMNMGRPPLQAVFGPRTGLIAYYPFDGNANDMAGGYDLVCGTNCPVLADGLFGQAYDFTGAEVLLKSSSSDTNFIPGIDETQTISVWFKTDQVTERKSILFKESGCIGWQVIINSEGRIFGTEQTGTGCSDHNYYWISSPGGTRYDDNTWHHVAFVIDRPNEQIELFIDGNSVSASTVDNIHEIRPATFRVGADWQELHSIEGLIDEVRIYNRALSL